jgi:hypothetical protein
MRKQKKRQPITKPSTWLERAQTAYGRLKSVSQVASTVVAVAKAGYWVWMHWPLHWPF